MTRDEVRGETRPALRRAGGMAGSWLLMGLMLGMLAGKGSGLIGLAAALTAGAIVMAPVGLLLAAVGGRGDESLAGGTVGMLLGLGAAAPDTAGLRVWVWVLGILLAICLGVIAVLLRRRARS